MPSPEELARLESLSYPIHPAANIFPLDDEHLVELAADIKDHGLHVPIEIMDGKIIDGRRRSLACRLAGVEPVFRYVSPDDAVQYVLSLNLHRRHLTTSQRAMVAAEVANLEHGKNKDTSNDVSQNDAATLLSVSVPSVQRAKVVLDSGDDALITAVKTGELPVSKAAEIVKERKPHVSHNSGENEWYTPHDYISAGREVLGSIDLDPASSHQANDVVQASQIFTVEDDGLEQAWTGRLWLNPPYAKDLCPRFIEKLVDEHLAGSVTEALVLVNNATETAWFQMATRASSAVCFPEKRVRFWKPDGTKGQPLQGQAVLYFGGDVGKFTKAFARFGQVLGRIGGSR